MAMVRTTCLARWLRSAGPAVIQQQNGSFVPSEQAALGSDPKRTMDWGRDFFDATETDG